MKITKKPDGGATISFDTGPIPFEVDGRTLHISTDEAAELAKDFAAIVAATADGAVPGFTDEMRGRLKLRSITLKMSIQETLEEE